MYDSGPDTREHIKKVQQNISEICHELIYRGEVHDASKLQEPEKSAFDSVGEKLRTLKYGTEEYNQSLKDLGPALQHHYDNNQHHPEFWDGEFDRMSLIDILEMLADWKAAVERTKEGRLDFSLAINAERFKMSDELADILRNTAYELGWLGENYN